MNYNLLKNPRCLIAGLLTIVFITSIQAQNKYLVKGKKEGENIVYYTTEGLFDKVYSYPKPKYSETVFVNLGKMNFIKALADTAGLYKTVLLKPGFAACRMNGYGEFTTNIKYTLATGYGGVLLGQKLKNGMWKARFANSQNELPENKDYYIVDGYYCIFLSPEGKYGLIDEEGVINVEPVYDNFRVITDIITFYSSNEMAFKSLEECFRTKDLSQSPLRQVRGAKFFEFTRGNEKDLYHLAWANGRPSGVLYKNYKKLGQHHLKSEKVLSNLDFYYFEHENGYVIYTTYLKEVENQFRYGFLEQVRRDTTPGADRNFIVRREMDLSRPIDYVKMDSIERVREANVLVDAVTGYYELKSWTEVNGTKYNAFTDKNYLSIRPEGTNHVNISVTFTGLLNAFAATDGVEGTITATNVLLEKGKIHSSRYGIGNSGVDGYLFSMPGLKTEEKRGGLKSFSGNYDPVNNELHLYGERHGFAGTIEIVAKRVKSLK